MRRRFLPAIVLSLAAVIALPSSACDYSPFKTAGCNATKVQCHCDGTGMATNCARLAASGSGSCCVKSPIPHSVAQYKAPEESGVAVPALVTGALHNLPPLQNDGNAVAAQGLPPSALQPLLCTFLI